MTVTDGTGGADGSEDAAGPTLANGRVSVRVDPADGAFAVDGLAGLGRLVDGSDCGDTWRCPPATDTLVDAPDAVEVSAGQGRSGPGCWSRRATSWPARCRGLDHRTGEVPHECGRCSTCGPASGRSGWR